MRVNTIAANLQSLYVIPNGVGFWRWACPLKLKKMAHRNWKRIVACSACDVAQNKRTCTNVDCSRRTYCVVYVTRGGKKKERKEKDKKEVDFHYSETKLIIQKFVF